MAEEKYPKAILPPPVITPPPVVTPPPVAVLPPPQPNMTQMQTTIIPPMYPVPVPVPTPVPVPMHGLSYLLRHIVAHGCALLPTRGPKYAMYHVALMAYLMGAGYDFLSAHMYADMLGGPGYFVRIEA